MKLFATALCVFCGIAAALFFMGYVLVRLWDPSKAIEAAVALAGVPMLTFPKLLEVLEQREGRKNLAAGKPAPIYDFNGYQIAWPLMVLCGSLVLITVSMLILAALVITSLSIFGLDLTEPAQSRASALLDLTVSVALSYFVGRWIGTRCSSKGTIAILLAIFLSTVIGLTIDRMVPDEPGEFPSWLADLIEFPLAIFAGVIGYRRGRKYRLSRYLHYLLGVLSPETRDTLIDLAFGEAQKIGSGRKWSLWSA
jgi:hypothetical protein